MGLHLVMCAWYAAQVGRCAEDSDASTAADMLLPLPVCLCLCAFACVPLPLLMPVWCFCN